MFQNFFRVISKNILVKTQKPQPCYCPNGLVAKVSVCQALPNESTDSNPAWANFFLNFFFHWTLECYLHVLDVYEQEYETNMIQEG